MLELYEADSEEGSEEVNMMVTGFRKFLEFVVDRNGEYNPVELILEGQREE